MGIPRGTALRILLPVLLLGLLVGLGFANFQFASAYPGGNALLPRWVGARHFLLDGANPYDPEVSLVAQEMIYGRPAIPEAGEDLAQFGYPLLSMVIFAPFGLLDYPVALAAWMTLLQISMAVAAFLAVGLSHWRPKGLTLLLLILFSLLWYHGFRALALGEFVAIEALLIAGALLAIRRGVDPLAGILLAVSLCMPSLSAPLIVLTLIWALSQRRWMLFLWTLGATVVLIGISLALVPSWPLQWIWQVLEIRARTGFVSIVGAASSIVPRISTWLNLGFVAVCVIYLLVEWRLALGKGDRWFLWTASLTITMTTILASHATTADYVVLVPVIFLVLGMGQVRWVKAGRFLTAITLGILTVLPWGLNLLTARPQPEHVASFFLVPLICMVLLWWVRWWATQPSGLLVDEVIRKTKLRQR